MNSGIPFNSRLIGNFCFPIFTFRKFHNDHSLSSAVAHSANPILPPFNYPPESKSHSSLFAHSFEWRDSFCAATRYARGWREKGGAKRPSSKRKRISVRVSPILLVLVKSVVVHARVKREKRGGKPEGRRRDVYIYIERETKRERLGRTAYSTRFIRRVISRVTFMTAGRAAFEGIRILKRRAQWGERREGRIKVKPAPPL